MTDVIWAELDALSKVKPFTKENLINHIEENPVYWNQLFDLKHITFSDLPNRAQIDLKQFLENELVMPTTGKSKKSAVPTKGKLPTITSVRASGETEKGLDRNKL